MDNQEPSVDNQNDVFEHSLVVSCNGQVAIDDCNGQISSTVCCQESPLLVASLSAPDQNENKRSIIFFTIASR